MKHTSQKLLSLLIAIFILLGTAVPFVLPVSAADPFEGWVTDGWTRGMEEGEPVLIGTRSNSMNLLCSEPTNSIYLEFDIYMEDSYGTADGSIGSAYKMTNGYQYFFEYNTVLEQVRVRRLGPGGETMVGAPRSKTLALKTWYHFMVVLAKDNIQWYLNGELLHTIKNSGSDPLSGGYWYIQGYYATPRIKNLRLYDSPENAFPDWNLNGWSIAAQDGELVITGQSDRTVTAMSTKETVDRNALALDIAVLDSRSDVDGNVGVTYTFANEQEYFFEYNTILKKLRIRRIISDEDGVIVAEIPFTMEINRWYRWRIMLGDDCIVWHIDGEKLLQVDDTHGDPLDSAVWTIQGYNATPKVKTLMLLIDDPNAAPISEKLDMEFTTADSLKGFVSDAGKLSLGDGARDGALVYTLGGEGTSFQSPTIMAPKGDAYCARLDIKNTIFLRLKNDTGATALRVYFKTETLNRYAEERSVLVEVTPHGGWETVYANFSGCPDAYGYLRGFKIVPVGATEGSISFDAITFEREKAFYDYSGKVNSCLADKNAGTVTVRGTLEAAYAGKKVNLYELDVTNWQESVKGLTPIHTTTANGTDFSFTFPLQNGKISQLSNLFICTVETPEGEVKVSDRFQVENYADFTENPYAFTLPDYKVSVTDSQWGAVGDGFTDDSDAIQAAIDAVSAHGGGTVVIPGDDSYYGRRYVITNVKIKSNVELRIEKGAVLWQSPRVADYKYDVVYGHDVYIAGVTWTHSCSCHNLPLIQGDGAKNIRITGGGSIRSVDTGSENLDSVDASTLWTGCENRIHVIPVGLFQCENIEVTNITLLRTNNYNFNLRDCERAYVGGLTVREVTCASGDGVSCTVGTKHVIIDRFTFYSNDDAVTICSTYNDPRGLVWWHPNPGDDNCVDDVTVIHSNIFGGHGITFIPWGTDAPDQSLQEIKNITVTDCVLSGGWSVGAWPDNPYYGKTFDNTETDDFSPVKNIRILGNIYKNTCTMECILATDVLTDCGITSASNFQNGDFERKRGKSGWTTGLSNWNWTTEGNGTVQSVANGSDHYGLLTGKSSLYQGLYLPAGKHTFTATTGLTEGKGRLFVRNVITGETVGTYDIPAGEGKELSFTFTLTAPASLYLGAELTETGRLTLDNCNISSSDVMLFPTDLDETFEKSTNPAIDYANWETKTENGNTFISYPNGSGSYLLRLGDKVNAFDLAFHVRVDETFSTVDGNLGVSFCRKDSNTQYFVEYNSVRHYILLRRFENGKSRQLFKEDFNLEQGTWHRLGLSYGEGVIRFYVDGKLVIDYQDKNPLEEGILALAGYATAMSLDNIALSPFGTMDLTADVPLKSEDYTLTFDGAGGDMIPASQTLHEGETPNLTAITNPVREGYTFKGWVDKNGDEVNLETFTMPAANVTLTARWEENMPPADDEPESDTTAEPANEPSEDKGLPAGAIIGIVIGAVVLLGGGFALWQFVFKKKKTG